MIAETQAAREQATIAIELLTDRGARDDRTLGAVRALAAAVHRLADVVDQLVERVER